MPKIKMLRPLELNENLAPQKVEELRATHSALLWLAENFPAAFPDHTKNLRPLAIGVHERLEAILSSERDTASSAPDIEILLRALQVWTRSAPYVHAAAAGRSRVDLDGNVVSELDPKHQQFAKDVIDRRKQRAATPVKPAPVPVSPPKPFTRPVLSLRRAQA